MSGLSATLVGDAPPRFVFLHGLFGRGRNWTQIAQGLARQEGSSALFDLPNHGSSPWTQSFSYDEMAAAVCEELEHRFDGKPVILVGHSMGGKVAMVAALTRPELFAGLAVVDISPTESGQVSSFGPYLAAMRGIDLTTLTGKADADRQLSDTVPNPAVRQFLLTNLRDRGGWHWQPNLELLHSSLAELAGWPDIGPLSYSGPTLWLVGERSPYYRRDDLASMRHYFPAVQEQVIPGAGHWVHADNPAAVVAALAGLSAASPK
jgi:esterase